MLFGKPSLHALQQMVCQLGCNSHWEWKNFKIRKFNYCYKILPIGIICNAKENRTILELFSVRVFFKISFPSMIQHEAHGMVENVLLSERH